MSDAVIPSTVVVGAAADTGPTYTVTINRDSGDSITDWTTCTGVVLLLPDGSTKTVTESSVTAAQWVGTVRYQAWWAASGPFTTKARATFADGSVITIPNPLVFSVADT